MLFLDIGTEKVNISAYGSQAGVPENFLKTEDVSAVYQVALGKSMAKSMRRTADSRYARSLTAAS